MLSVAESVSPWTLCRFLFNTWAKKSEKPCLCCKNVLMSETLSLGCVDGNRRVLYAVGVLCELGVFSSLLQFPVSPVHTRTSSSFRGRTLLAVDQPNAELNLIQVNGGSFVYLIIVCFCEISPCFSLCRVSIENWCQF